MPSVQVDSKHPVHVTPVEDEKVVVKCLGSKVFYKEEPSVSSTNKTGELTEGQTLTIEQQAGQWFIAEEGGATLEVQQPTTEGVSTAEIDNGAVTEPKHANEAVTGTKVKNGTLTGAKVVANSIEPEKVKKATTPVAGAVEGEVILGTAGVVRTILAAWTAKHEAKPKVKIKHGLNIGYVGVVAWKASAKVAVEQVAIEKVVYVSAEEIEVTLTAEPAAKEELFFVVQG